MGGETTGNALDGLLLLMLGAVLWIVASFAGALCLLNPQYDILLLRWLRVIGLVVMVGGPVWLWIVTPIRSRRRKK